MDLLFDTFRNRLTRCPRLVFPVVFFHSIKNVAEQLIQAFPIVFMVRAPKQSAQFMLTQGELIQSKYLKQIICLQVQSYFQLPQYHIVTEYTFRLRWLVTFGPSILYDQPIQKAG